MGKPDTVKDQKGAAKEADRHAITAPTVDRAKCARTVTTTRVSDLFKTLQGLPGHWTQLQQEVSRGNNHFAPNGRTDEEGKKLITFISDSVISAAKAAMFDFPLQQLKFTADMGWLKIERANGKVNVKSKA